jgi:hypothetical protein
MNVHFKDVRRLFIGNLELWFLTFDSDRLFLPDPILVLSFNSNSDKGYEFLADITLISEGEYWFNYSSAEYMSGSDVDPYVVAIAAAVVRVLHKAILQ